MSTETSTQSLTPSWWVHFKPETGKITGISSRKINAHPGYQVIESHNELLQEIARGVRTKRDFVVRKSFIDEQFIVLDKHSKLISTDFNITLVPAGNIEDAIVHLIINTETKTAQFQINYSELRNNISDVQFDEYVGNNAVCLDYYIVDKRNPDNLIAKIPVDKTELLTRGIYQTEIPDIAEMLKYNQINIKTRNIFSTNYSISKQKITPNEKRLLIQTSDGQPGHVSVMPTTGGINVTSSLTYTEKYFQNNKKNLQILVCNANIDNVIGGFKLPFSKLYNSTEVIYVPLDFDLPDDVLLVYQNKFIKLEYQETRNVNQH